MVPNLVPDSTELRRSLVRIQPGAFGGTLVTVAAVTEVPQQLPGGLGNQGQVVRIGDTVRRPAGPHSEAVNNLLEHLRTSGFDVAPTVLGRDPEGRDVHKWIDGDVPIAPFPAWALADLAMAARMWIGLRPGPDDDPPDATALARRLGCLVAGYGLASAEHEEFVDAIIEAQRVGNAFVRGRVEAGEPGFVAMWDERGGAEWFDGVTAWMEAQRSPWLEALRT